MSGQTAAAEVATLRPCLRCGSWDGHGGMSEKDGEGSPNMPK